MNSIEHISDCFKDLPAKDMAFLNEKKTQITYLKGETIFKQGAFATNVLFVCEGLVRVYLQIGIEKQINIRLARKGDYMAFSTIFNKNTYAYSATALVDSKICMIEKGALQKVIMRNARFSMQMTSMNSLNENRYLDIIHNVTYKQTRGKLASVLLYLASERFREDSVFQYLTRQDIANFASITVESTVKILKEFEREGIISLQNKNIAVHKSDLLSEISRKG